MLARELNRERDPNILNIPFVEAEKIAKMISALQTRSIDQVNWGKRSNYMWQIAHHRQSGPQIRTGLRQLHLLH